MDSTQQFLVLIIGSKVLTVPRGNSQTLARASHQRCLSNHEFSHPLSRVRRVPTRKLPLTLRSMAPAKSGGAMFLRDTQHPQARHITHRRLAQAPPHAEPASTPTLYNAIQARLVHLSLIRPAPDMLARHLALSISILKHLQVLNLLNLNSPCSPASGSPFPTSYNHLSPQTPSKLGSKIPNPKQKFPRASSRRDALQQTPLLSSSLT